MTLSLYSATVPSQLQILEALIPLIDKAETFCQEKGIPAAEIIQARLAEDMLPFTFQITSVCHHSKGAIEGVKKGEFSPNRDLSDDFVGLKNRLLEARDMLQGLTEQDVNSLVGKNMRFTFPGVDIPFAAEEFLLSFSQPNFYFHAATAYNILRWKGLNIGKRDFLGKMRSL